MLLINHVMALVRREGLALGRSAPFLSHRPESAREEEES